MVLIFLAAGKGVRANSQVLNCPKILLKASNGKSLLVNMLDKIQGSNLPDTRVRIVVGFLRQQIIEAVETFNKGNECLNIEIVYNEMYERGVITSLFRGLQKINDDVVILNGDTYYSSDLFTVLKSVQKSTLLVMPRHESPDSIRVMTANDSIISVGKKLEEYSYISTGCLFLNRQHVEKMVTILENLINYNTLDRMIWHDIINLLAASGDHISYWVVKPNSIFEIDTPIDYQNFLTWAGD